MRLSGSANQCDLHERHRLIGSFRVVVAERSTVVSDVILLSLQAVYGDTACWHLMHTWRLSVVGNWTYSEQDVLLQRQADALLGNEHDEEAPPAFTAAVRGIPLFDEGIERDEAVSISEDN